MRREEMAAALLVPLACAPVLAQSAAEGPLDALVRVRAVSLGTGEPLEEVSVWVGRKPFVGELPLGFRGRTRTAELAYRNMEGVGELLETPASGEVELRVPSGIPLHAAAMCGRSGDWRTLEPLRAGERRAQTFQLWSGKARFHGLVLERAGGAPVLGAQILGFDLDGTRQEETKTDAAGRFCIDSSEMSLDARISVPGLALATGYLTLGHADSARPQVFRLARPATIRGRVLGLDGRPIVRTRVQCSVERYSLYQPSAMPERFGQRSLGALTSWETVTDAEGRFLLGELPPRAWLELTLPDERPPWSELLVLAPGEEREISIAPEARVTLRGVALDQAGMPAAGLQLRARRFALEGNAGPDALCQTGGDGAFRLAGLEPGTWLIGPTANPESADFARREERVEVPADPREQELTLRLECGLFLRGRVWDSGGEPASGARIELRTSKGQFVREARSVEDGFFSIGPVPDGAYLLRASRYGFFVSDALAARAGAYDLELCLPPSTGWIAVGTPENTAALLPSTQLFPRDRPDLARSEYFALHIHESLFENLEAGSYDVVLTTEDGRQGRAEGLVPTAEGTRVSLDLEPCATLRVVFTGPELHALVLARHGTAVYSSAVTTRGTACALFVPPGTASLELFPLSSLDSIPAGPPRTREVEAVLGEEPEILWP